MCGLYMCKEYIYHFLLLYQKLGSNLPEIHSDELSDFFADSVLLDVTEHLTFQGNFLSFIFNFVYNVYVF